MLAGENDHAAVGQTGEGRAINRHNYTTDEIDGALDRPVVRRLLDLIRLRNGHPAFEGALEVEQIGRGRLRLAWRAASSSCSLDVDVSSGQLTIDQGPLDGLDQGASRITSTG
jgi:sucrose phosphorylase